jgi:hypothetical protein
LRPRRNQEFCEAPEEANHRADRLRDQLERRMIDTRPGEPFPGGDRAPEAEPVDYLGRLSAIEPVEFSPRISGLEISGRQFPEFISRGLRD